MGDLFSIFLLSLLAMLNPTLLAAVTVMLLLPSPKKLMFGYLMGAYLTSITLGMLIVFTLHDDASVSTAKHSLSPIEDLVIGALMLVVAYALGGARAEPLRERRQRRQEEKAAKAGEKQSFPERLLGRGSTRITFVVGVLLSFPGVSYLAALTRTAKLDYPVVPTVLIVLCIAIIQQTLLEVPLVGYAVAPEKTGDRVARFRAWLGRNGRRSATIAAATIGGLLILRGLIVLLL
jgi:Sap, sulfolipid-1-addressing protein